MRARKTIARYQSKDVSFSHEGKFYFLSNGDTYAPKSRLYSLKKRIVQGTAILPTDLHDGAFTVEGNTVRSGYPRI